MSGTTRTQRTIVYLLASLFQDGQQPNSIRPQAMRDFNESVFIVTPVPQYRLLELTRALLLL
jgi:hypothetical protein